MIFIFCCDYDISWTERGYMNIMVFCYYIIVILLWFTVYDHKYSYPYPICSHCSISQQLNPIDFKESLASRIWCHCIFYSMNCIQGSVLTLQHSYLLANALILISRFISFDEFQHFEGLLCEPDALYRVAFKIFDRTATGSLTFGELLISL